MAGSFLWNFTITRRGSATNGKQRLRAYSEVRRWLALDHDLSPELRRDLQERLEVLGVNPLEESVSEEMRIAQRQYAALRAYAEDPKGLATRLANDREKELTAYKHKPTARAGYALARVATLGIYRHHEPEHGAGLTAALDVNRRTGREVRSNPNAAGN